MNRLNFSAFFLLVTLLLVERNQGEYLRTPNTYNGGSCTADKRGVFRIAIQYCDGSDWLTMQPSGKPGKPLKPKGVLGTSCKDILKKGLSHGDGEYLIDPEENGKGFQVHCDMTSFGGGWTMCYTTDSHVDIRTQLTTKPHFGYRADCNNIPFKEVIFVDEKSKLKAAFAKTGSPIKFSGNYNKRADAFGLWTAQGVAPTEYKYQLLICDISYYKGLHVTGYTNCYKQCSNWCSDTTTSYFRTAAQTDLNRNGVAFNENGHRPLKNRLITAGIR